MRHQNKLITALAALALIASLASTAEAKDRRDGRNDRKVTNRSRSHATVNAPAARHNMRRLPVMRQVRRFAPRGHWENRTVTVLVRAGYWQRQRVAALYELRFDFSGQQIFVCVQPERITRVWIQPRYEYRTRRVWVENRQYNRGHNRRH